MASIQEIHFNFTGAWHYEVVEIISVFHVDQLSRAALRFVESLRLTLCLLVCPGLFWPRHESGALEEPAGVVRTVGLAEHLSRFFSQVRYLASAGGEAESEEASEAWGVAEREIREVSSRLQQWVLVSELDGSRALLARTYATFDPLIQRVLNMVVDFQRSLAEDTCTFFRAPNHVAREMLPSQGSGLAESPGVNIFSSLHGNHTLEPAFMEMLLDEPRVLTQPTFAGFRECQDLPRPRTRREVRPLSFLDLPRQWVHRDVSGVPRRLASPSQLLRAVAQHARLSHLVISVQVAPYLLSESPRCGSRLMLYDPSYCLIEQQWGGYHFQMNPFPPYNMSVVYTGKSLGPGADMPMVDVHSIHVPTMDIQWSSLVSTFKSMNHHSPDLLFISPFVGNCGMADKLLKSGSVRPKLVYLPINPLEAPRPGPEGQGPVPEAAPDIIDWWTQNGQGFLAQLSGTSGATTRIPVTTSMWLAQCSLAASTRIMRSHRYELLHVEHTYAAYLWRPLHRKLFGAEAVPDEDAVSMHVHEEWLKGWRCSPLARSLFDLEALAGTSEETGAYEAARIAVGDGEGGQGPLSRSAAREYAATVIPQTPTMSYFLERSEGGAGPRGRCVEGLCECLPPYRGSFCQHEDPALVPQRLKSAIHYITTETERDLLDLARSLATLWRHFNSRHDYPVIVFHEGLSPRARRRIVGASENRVWLAMLPRFVETPAEWAEAASEMAQDFPEGYRAMIRWRSGPVFLEPALAGFDYAMTLDTDSYFPADLGADPFEFVQENGLTAAFPHLGRESASVVVNFVHHFLLYCRLRGLHPRRTRMLESLLERNFKWYQQCLMLDIEVLRLDFFRGERYQDVFRYMDSTGGFWLHRWGNNPVRTFAVALLLEDRDVRSLALPYAHQDYCSCGPGPRAAPCLWDASAERFRCEASGLGAAEGPRLAAGDLDEGLLDLQPWRGTDRQRERFSASDIVRFVAEQMPANDSVLG